MQVLLEENSWAKRLRFVFWLLLIVGLIGVLVVLARGPQLVIRNPDAYQAVFLDNGQVYFGKLSSLNREFWSLTDIYYLRAGAVQQAGASPEAGLLDLIKLGSELHAPQDEMIVNKAHVLFYEDLGEGGEVMKLIRKHKAESRQ